MKKFFALMMTALMLLGLVACGGSSDNGGEAAQSADLTALYDSMGETLPDMMLMDEGSMMNYYGVDASACKQAVMAICADGLRADEVWLFEANNADALKDLKAKAESRLTAKEDETSDYTPDQYEVVKEAELYTVGNYLVFLVSPEVDTLKAAVDAALS